MISLALFYFSNYSICMIEKEPKLPPVEIPQDALSEDALDGIIKSFIMREGTDYGVVEISFATKVLQIKKQIESGKIKIAFDPNEESVTLLDINSWNKLTRNT